MIDLITNSSTEIFVDCADSVKPAKELLAEFLKLTGTDKTVDEVFEVTLEEDQYNLESWFDYYFEEDSEVYDEYKDKYKLDDEDYDTRQNNLKALVADYKAGKCDDIEIDSYHIQKNLIIRTKEEKFANIPELLDKFLNSPDHYEYCTG